jgi:hypothetical protein
MNEREDNNTIDGQQRLFVHAVKFRPDANGRNRLALIVDLDPLAAVPSCGPPRPEFHYQPTDALTLRALTLDGG